MIYTDGFIKSNKMYMLEEYHRTTDLLDLENNLSDFFDKITTIKESCIVGLIGKLGSGKTTFMNQFSQRYENVVFTFEAWKYPGRKDLWENFVLEIAEQQSKKEMVIKKIDGKQNEDKKTLVDILKKLPGERTKYLPGLESLTDGIKYFLETSPATRTFQLQQMLTELFESVKSDTIYVVVEDVDRAGDEGLFFLETLSYYIKEIDINKQIIVIALIGEENYRNMEKKLSFQKCLDIKYPFSITNPGFSKFIEELFIDEIVNTLHLKGQIQSFLEGIFLEYPHIATMRLVKSILRQANMNYKALVKEQGEGIDWRLSILFETAKEIQSEEGVDFFNKRKKGENINDRNTIFGGLINVIIFENHRMKNNGVAPIYILNKNEQSKRYKVIEWQRTVVSIKILDNNYINDSVKDAVRYIINFSDEKYFGISNVYFR